MNKFPKLDLTGDADRVAGRCRPDEKSFLLRPSLRYVLLKITAPLTLCLFIVIAASAIPVPYISYLASLPLLFAMYRTAYLLMVRYEISENQIKYHRGVFYYKTDFLEMYRIKDYKIDQPFLLRLIGVMHFTMETSDRSHPYFRMKGIPNSNIADVVRQLVERVRVTKRVYEVD